MTKENPEDEQPSKLALANAREIGELSSVTKSLASDVSSLARDMREGFAHQDQNISRLSERINRPPDKSLYVGMAAILLAGIPIIGSLIYFVVTSSLAPISERLIKVEQSEQIATDHAWDNFELEVRDDQALIDSGLKANETDTVANTDRKNEKRKKHRPKSP